MLDFVGKVVKRTGDAVVGAADSFIVKGASKVGAAAIKGGVEGAAWVGKKALDGVNTVLPRVKNIDGKKVSDGIGKAVNKTMVGVDGDYRTLGKAVNDSAIGKLYTNRTGNVLMDDNTAIRRKGSFGDKPKTTYVSSKNTFGLADAVTDRAKLYMDGAAHIVRGDSWLTLKQPLVKTGTNSALPSGLRATGMGTALAVGGSLISGTPDAVKKWNDSKRGINYDSQPSSIAPRVPAYANNGGATGDLVFALNNLRHGGMM